MFVFFGHGYFILWVFFLWISQRLCRIYFLLFCFLPCHFSFCPVHSSVSIHHRCLFGGDVNISSLSIGTMQSSNFSYTRRRLFCSYKIFISSLLFFSFSTFGIWSLQFEEKTLEAWTSYRLFCFPKHTVDVLDNSICRIFKYLLTIVSKFLQIFHR